MDLTPPLTRSPDSTPNTYCPSEASSSDYPSPDSLVEQHYSISSAFESNPACSMAPSVSSDCHSPRLNAGSQPEWSPASALHPALTAASLTHILSAEYDVFATYDASYANDVYSGRGPASSHQSLPVSRSPVSTVRTSSQYPSISSPSRPGTPRLQSEDMASEFGHGMDISHYPSPTMGNESYSGDVSSHTSLPPLGPPQHANTGYTTEGMLASWPRPTEYPAEPDQLYSGSSIQPSLMLPMKRSSPRAGGERSRRAPRRLTTKEDANFQCDIKGCGKFFSRSYNFKAHMETHREKRDYPFPCQNEDCTKRFVRKTDLQRHHQSVHMKERTHGCEYCGRMFARKDTLKRYASPSTAYPHSDTGQ